MAKAKAKAKIIETLKLYYDPKGETLTVWFDNPNKECVSEETGEEVILNKDRQGRVIGFEKLNVTFPQLANLKSLPVEIMVSEL